MRISLSDCAARLVNARNWLAVGALALTGAIWVPGSAAADIDCPAFSTSDRVSYYIDLVRQTCTEVSPAADNVQVVLRVFDDGALGVDVTARGPTAEGPVDGLLECTGLTAGLAGGFRRVVDGTPPMATTCTIRTTFFNGTDLEYVFDVNGDATGIAASAATARIDYPDAGVGINGLANPLGPAGDRININFRTLYDLEVTGLEPSDFETTNATVSDIQGSGTDFTALVIPDGPGPVSVRLREGTTTHGVRSTNRTSNTLNGVVMDGTAPVVTITGVPDQFRSAQSATVTFDWAENVTGFGAGDITVTGGTLSGLSGGPQVWTAQLSIAGDEDVTVSVAAGAVLDSTGMPSAAASVTGTFARSAVTEALIRSYMGARATALIGAQQKLGHLLDRRDATGSVSVTQGIGNVRLFTGANGDVWAALDAQWSDIEGATSSYTNLSFGAHTRLRPDRLLGVMMQIDRNEFEDGIATVDGVGWLIGPYYVARHGEVDLDARLLWGRTENDISPFGTYVDTFESTRILAMLNVSGAVAMQVGELRPLAGFAYVSDRSEDYTDALSNLVSGQHVELTELEGGFDWAIPLEDTSGTEFVAGITGIYAKQQGGNDVLDGGRARVDLGLTRPSDGAFGYDIGVWKDGLFASDRESYGAEIEVNWRF